MKEITVNQVNTGKQRKYELESKFEQYNVGEFVKLISRQEMIPSKSITLKKYKGDILTGHLMMKELYPDGVVYYNAKHI